MKLFKKNSSKKCSKKPVEDWGREEVLRWLAYLGMSKYEEAFRAITGKRLLQLGLADLYQLVQTQLAAELVHDSIIELKDKQDKLSAVPSKFSLTLKRSNSSSKPPLSSSSGGSSTLPAKPAHQGIVSDGLQSVRTSAPDSDRGSPLARSSTASASFLGNNSPRQSTSRASSSATPASGSPAAPSSDSVGHNAAVLAPHVGGEEVVNELYGYMNYLGIQGIGLVEATQRAPVVGHIIGALWEGHDLVRHARGNRTNCQQAGAYSQDILRVFDAEGKRLAFIDGGALTQLLQHIETGNALLDSCCRPGWLLRMATNERSMEEFQAVHNIILETLRAEKVDTLPNGRQLTYGEYRDVGRPLRRMLKQLGAGSLERGLAAVRSDEAALQEVSQLVHVEPSAVMEDLQESLPGKPDAVQRTGSNAANGMRDDRKRECENIFHQYDKNRSGALEFEELRSVLGDLGMLDGIKPIDIESATSAQFALADADGDGRITFSDFLSYYGDLETSQARQELRQAFGPQAEKDLKKIFCSFASFGVRQHLEELDGPKFSKLCRDCKLLGRGLNPIDVDLIFASSKPKGQRKVQFDEFLAALSKVADKKSQSLAEVVRGVLLAGGPTVNSTKANYIKFHDDKSTYTGVHARGGPSTVDPSKDLSALLDRSESDVRGVKKPAADGEALPSARTSSATPPASGSGVRSSMNSRVSPSISPGLSREGSVLGSPSGTPTSRSSHTTPFSSPQPAPASIGNSNNLTPPSASRTGSGGVRASMGNLPLSRLALSSLASDADKSPALSHRSSSARENDPGSGNKGPRASTPASPIEWEEGLQEEVQDVFAAFALYGAGNAAATPRATAVELDGARFAKLCRESGLLGGRLNSTAVDLVFSRIKPKGVRKIGWAAFEKALGLLADERRTDVLTVAHAVAACHGPRHNATTASVRVRLHDDKSTYTGVYANGGPSTRDKRLTIESLTDRDSVSPLPKQQLAQ